MSEDIKSIPIFDENKNDIIKCSLCGCDLLEILHTNPNISSKTKIRAECPYCGGKSYISEIEGGFHMGFTDFTVYTNVEMIGDVMLIKTQKGEKEWKS
jgi:DNA-directed RNA polymerase subunit RPC12/RpoP